MGVEYDSPSGSSRPPVLCDPSSRPRLVVGELTLETTTVDVEKKTTGQADGRTDRQAAGGRNGQRQSVDVEKTRVDRQTGSRWMKRRQIVSG